MWGTPLFRYNSECIVIAMVPLLLDNDKGSCLEPASDAATLDGINSSSTSNHAKR
jgi:hypothetical protein